MRTVNIRLSNMEFTGALAVSVEFWGKNLWSEFKRESEVNWRPETTDNNRNQQYYHNIPQILQLTLKRMFMFIIFIMVAVIRLTARSCY